VRTRQLAYASGGHHAAYLVGPEREHAIPLKTRNVVIGAVPGMGFKQGSVEVPPGASLYVFSDGVFEIVDREGRQWGLDDFVPLILQPPATGVGESQRIFQAVRAHAQPGPFEDDFSLVVLTFA
jgi:serine phosphatase RsbU (regulator of sigma subunit)